MSIGTTETLQSLFARLSSDILKNVPPEERPAVQALLYERADELLRAGADGGTAGFVDLIGLGPTGSLGWNALAMPRIDSDFDEAVIPSQLHAAAELYFIYQHERMKVFRVVDVLVQLFHEGRMRIQRGPGARALYLLEKHKPLRYTVKDRKLAYKRAFNYGGDQIKEAVVNRSFHRQFVAFISAIAQYFRDLRISEVIKGGPMLDQRPFGSQASIQRLGSDLRWQIDRATYGNIVALTVETGNYLKTVLEALESPDIKRSFDANNKWDVVEIVSQRFLGGAHEISQRTKMADAGRRMLQFAADNTFSTRDPNLFLNEIAPLGPLAEEWLAAYQTTREGAGFQGVEAALRGVAGTSTKAA